MIESWEYEIHIRCADAELPKAIAAALGHYKPDVHYHLTHQEVNDVQLSQRYEYNPRQIGVRHG